MYLGQGLSCLPFFLFPRPPIPVSRRGRTRVIVFGSTQEIGISDFFSSLPRPLRAVHNAIRYPTPFFPRPCLVRDWTTFLQHPVIRKKKLRCFILLSIKCRQLINSTFYLCKTICKNLLNPLPLLQTVLLPPPSSLSPRIGVGSLDFPFARGGRDKEQRPRTERSNAVAPKRRKEKRPD